MARAAAVHRGARLPAERSSFVGRRAELAEVRRLLGDARLLTLVGPGGVGKTRLALRAAAELRRSFPGGVVLADLTAVSDPSLVAQQVAAALDVRDSSGRWLPAALAEVLGEDRVLLVLDNCEHLRDACAVLVDAVLAACPGLQLLATSRAPLDVPGEALFPVPPLPLPAAGDAAGSDAVRLLAERARAAAPGLVLGPADEADLAELCRRLDGIPLAIELAAVRLRTLGPADLLARLDDRFALLRRSGGSVPERHRALRATMEWSAELLGDGERVLWRRLSVFAADVDLAAIEAVCPDDLLPAASVLEVLTALVQASVVEVTHGAAGPRFRMLETVRAFGREQLVAAGEVDAVRLRHRDWCAGVVTSAAAQFLGPGQVAAFDRLSACAAEIGAALETCLSRPGDAAVGLSLAAELWLWWEARGRLAEGRRWLSVLLARETAESAARAHGLVVAGYLALAATDPDTAVPLLEEGQELGRRLDLPATTALAVQYLGLAALFRSDLRTADRLLREAAAAHRAVDAPHAAFCWADVGVVALLAGDLVAADEAFTTSLEQGAGGDAWTRSHALWGLGLVRLDGGEPAAAAALEEQALLLMREVDDRSGVALCVEALAWAAAAAGDPERAALLTGAADAVWRSVPAALPAPLVRYREACTASARRALGARRWSAGTERGGALGRADAVRAALREEAAGALPPQRGAGGLTRRQQEVADLVVEGLTDREIAARLVISPRTAESHVQQILTRLGLRSRAQLAAWRTLQH
ncbi:ATP-binding protein [Modestobacter altitudinis]|uniref:ATP-binding protein n=1 Tax=Modestobacter altitudinis TaxID=2213158 RepID=UPI00148716FE|nr:LuxR C-terminal-related transcriptional regulator [Modestobacter altitudinis]